MTQDNPTNWFTGRISFDGADVHNIIEEGLKNNIKIRHWWFQTEIGENKQKHWQITWQCKKKGRKTEFKDWFVNLIKKVEGLPVYYLEPCAKDKGKHAVYYVTKCDSRINGPWSDVPIYTGKDLKCMETPFPWQKSILDKLKTEADDRSLIWIYDNKGCNGKSKLFKYLGFNKLASLMKVDNADRLSSIICSRGPQPAYLVDIPRTVCAKKSMSSVYEVLESLKDGYCFSCMFGKEQELYMDSPWVIVFANIPPEISRVTNDRWQVFEIDDTRRLKKLSTDAIIEIRKQSKSR